jgi:hypothetical protein
VSGRPDRGGEGRGKHGGDIEKAIDLEPLVRSGKLEVIAEAPP